MKWVLLIYVTLISGCSGIRFCHEPYPHHSSPEDNHGLVSFRDVIERVYTARDTN